MRKKRLILWLCVPVTCVLMFIGCDSLMYPTVADVKMLNESNLEYQAGLQELTVETMTDQHGRMSPENQEWFDAMLAQNAQFVLELKDAGVQSAASMSGPDIMGTNGWAMLVSAFPGLAGVGLWLRNTTKPSRSAEQVAKLEAEAKEMAKELVEVKLALATAAKTGEAIPSDS